MLRRFLPALALALVTACGGSDAHYDVLITGGTVYDGSGEEPVQADVGIIGDRVAAVGDLSGATADETVDATDLAVAPGFINESEIPPDGGTQTKDR